MWVIMARKIKHDLFFFPCSFPPFYETLCQNCVFLPGFQLNQYVCCHVGECDLFPETTQSVDLNLKIKGGVGGGGGERKKTAVLVPLGHF